MYTFLNKRIGKTASILAIAALLVGGFGSSLGSLAVARADEPATVTVTIDKYMDGGMATASNSDGLPFTMSATWNATNIGAGTGSYDLGPSNTVPYEAVTADMSSGADYSTNEMTD